MVIRVWDFILIGIIRDRKSCPLRLTCLALLRFAQIFLASKKCRGDNKFCSSCPVLPHISLNARVCVRIRVCILYHFQKTSSLSFSFVCSYGCIFSIYFAFISSISIGLVKTSPTCSKPNLSHSHPTQVFPSLKKRRDKDGATHDPTAPHPIAILLNCDPI